MLMFVATHTGQNLTPTGQQTNMEIPLDIYICLSISISVHSKMYVFTRQTSIYPSDTDPPPQTYSTSQQICKRLDPLEIRNLKSV